MADVNISKFRAQVVRDGSKPATPGFVVSEGQNPVDPAGSGQNHLPVTIGTPANGLAVTDAQVLTIDKAQIFAGTSSQFVKGDGTLDSTAYGTGSVTSVGLTMPTAFSVANSPITTAGTLAVTATGTTAQYIRGDGTLATFPALTGFVPYTGATADVNLGTHDLTAERGTFENNGSSNTLTVNHTSGSGYGIIVTKGGNNEALYVSKTSGSGNAMTVVGGRTSLVDLALSSVTNTAGDFLTLSGGVVHKRTAAQTLTDIGGQAALTNPVTGTGTTNYLPKFTGASTIGDSVIADNATEINIPKRIFLNSGGQSIFFTPNLSSASNRIEGSSGVPLEIFTSGSELRFAAGGVSTQVTLLSSGNVGIGTTSPSYPLQVRRAGGAGSLGISIDSVGTTDRVAQYFAIQDNSFGAGTGHAFYYRVPSSTTDVLGLFLNESGNLLVGTTTDAGFKLDVNGTGRFSGDLTLSAAGNRINSGNELRFYRTDNAIYTQLYDGGNANGFVLDNRNGEGFSFQSAGTNQLRITNSGNVGIGTSSPGTSPNNTLLGFALGSNIQARTAVPQLALSSNIDGDWFSPTYKVSNFATQIYLDSNQGTMGFRTAPSGTAGAAITWNTPAILITNGGNVGIGTSSPGQKLEVNNGASSSYVLVVGQSRNLYLGQDSIGAAIYSDGSAPMYFATNANERMRITSGGNVLIGTTTDSGQRLQVNGVTRILDGNNLTLMQPGNGNGSNIRSVSNGDFIVTTGGTADALTIRNDGLVFISGLISSFTTSNAANMFVSAGDGAIYRSTSSIKYKKNVKNYEKGLKEVLNLRPVTYEGLGKIDSNKTFAGLIAEEVHELGLNEFVQYAEDGTPDALGYQNMIALLTKAIQELKQEIDTLKN
jgi:hypothetical protein